MYCIYEYINIYFAVKTTIVSDDLMCFIVMIPVQWMIYRKGELFSALRLKKSYKCTHYTQMCTYTFCCYIIVHSSLKLF